jgi:cytochrome oxidase Cu insertion factor (SCO1/SenC/PrrC family)
MNAWLRIGLIAACCLHWPAVAAEKTPGLKVGEKAPNFTLTDQSGKPFNLAETLKKGPTAIVFHRSANW